MDGDPNPTTPGFESILAWIEDRLDTAPGETLTLERIAAYACLSPYHFSRRFTARMGRSVMAYVRRRRLARAARRLATEPGLKLIELALDCGFESQEAFTRAFKRTFGVSPGRFRRAGFGPAPQNPMETLVSASNAAAPGSSGVRVEQLPGLVRREAFSVAGLSRRFNEASKAAIPDLWQSFVGSMPFEGQNSWETFGVVGGVDRQDGSFSYMAAGQLDPAAATPKGLERKDLAAGDYLVFRMTLTGGPLHPQVREAMAHIWGELIPASGATLTDAPDFEAYDGRFEPTRPGAVIDFHVPVRA